jgi:hypothetical protein
MPSSVIAAERLAEAARAQTALPGAQVRQARPAWPERLSGIWGVTVESSDRRTNAFLRVSDGRVAVPAGMAQAARELSELRPLDGHDWGGGLIYIVVAAGGAPPGFPDTWDAEEAPGPDGGVRVTVHMPEAWVEYAAAGGVGLEPSGVSTRPGALAPPLPMAKATLEIATDYGLAWHYVLGGRVIDGPVGRPAREPPALSDDELVAALGAARARARAPRAMPVSEPRPWPEMRDLLVVDLCALGPVYVPAGGASPAVDWTSPLPVLVPLLCAAHRLPPGLIPDDLLPSAEVIGAELVALLPAPIVEWSAGGGRGRSPKVRGVKSDAEMSRRGRVRCALGTDGWLFDVLGAEGEWEPARGDVP